MPWVAQTKGLPLSYSNLVARRPDQPHMGPQQGPWEGREWRFSPRLPPGETAGYLTPVGIFGGMPRRLDLWSDLEGAWMMAI